jgi:hypothetical protein
MVFSLLWTSRILTNITHRPASLLARITFGQTKKFC